MNARFSGVSLPRVRRGAASSLGQEQVARVGLGAFESLAVCADEGEEPVLAGSESRR